MTPATLVHPNPASGRTLVLTMDQQTAVELARLGGSVLGGALGLEAIRRWADRRRQRRQQPIELTAKLIDDGDEMRRLLLDRVARLEEQHAASVERAHRAELELATARPEIDKLRRRLERKDEACKALTQQLLAAGLQPVLYSDPYSDGPREIR
jgi:hypothetical protein